MKGMVPMEPGSGRLKEDRTGCGWVARVGPVWGAVPDYRSTENVQSRAACDAIAPGNEFSRRAVDFSDWEQETFALSDQEVT